MDKNTETKIVIAIPAFNEAKIIQEVINEIKTAGYSNIIIVDDGSSDDTQKEASKIEGVVALKHKINRGKGAAAKTAIEAAKMIGADIIVTMDGDGQHNPKDIKKLTSPIINEGYDVVLGSRLKNSKGMPWYKIIHNKIGNAVTWYLYGLWVTDSQSGMRAYSIKAAEKINTRADRYEYDSEVIKEIYAYKLKHIEVPIEVRYTEYSMGKIHKQSLINGIKTVYRMLWNLLS